MEIIKAESKADIKSVAGLAQIIWDEHYPPIIGKKQVDYMLENFQSESAVTQQIKDGYEYYLVKYNGEYAGYFAIRPDYKEGFMLLSKLYVHKSFRGLGIAKTGLEFIVNRAKTLNLNKIYLTVNKYNHTAIEFYTKMRFRKTESFKKDIGGGFIMDDYGMVKTI